MFVLTQLNLPVDRRAVFPHWYEAAGDRMSPGSKSRAAFGTYPYRDLRRSVLAVRVSVPGRSPRREAPHAMLS